MGTIAEKLTYLNTTKGKIKDSINNIGGDITNQTTFREYATALDNIFYKLPKVSGSGIDLSLTPTLRGKILSTLKGNTYQKTLSGKNLLNIQGIVKGRLDNGVIGYASNTTDLTLNDNSFSFTTNVNYRGTTSDYILVNNNEYILSCTSPSNLYVIVACYDSNKTYLRDTNISYVSGHNNQAKFTLQNDVAYIRIYFYLSQAGTITIEKPQLEQGTTATDYEQYCGGTPSPNPSYPQPVNVVSGDNEIVVCGKNLFDKNNIKSGYLIQVDGSEVANTSYGASDYIPVKANTQYTRVNCNNYYGAFYDNNKNFVGAIQNANTITPSVDGYVRISFLLTNVDSVQLEQGNQATTYEAYNGNVYPINLSKNLLDVSKGRLGTFYGLTISYSNNKLILNGTSTNLVDFYVATSVSTPKYNGDLIDYLNTKLGTYTLSNNKGFENYFRVGGSYITDTATITNSNQVDLIFVRIPQGTYDNEELDIQLEIGNQATTYEPYNPIEMCKINTYEDSFLRNTGKNLFDKDNAIVGKNWNGDTMAYSIANDDYIPVEEGKSYIISVANMSNYSSTTIVRFDENKNVISPPITTNPFTIPTGTKYIKISIRSATTYAWTQDDLDKASYQLEQNSEATTYEPYGNGEWYKKANIGEVVLDGSESWEYYNNPTSTNYAYITTTIVDNYTANIYNGYSNNFENYNTWFIYNTSTNKEMYSCGSGTSPKLRIMILKSRLSSLDTTGIKNWFANNNTKIKYVLATPTYTKITGTLATQLEEVYNAKSNDGTTNISQVPNDLPFNLDISVLMGN